ncbi:MAG: aldo/keto reductase [Pseudomonadales bacterium]|nr:aldo/keto reductase [Pseudomonadales bacterium]
MIPKVQLAPDYAISQLIAGGWQLQNRGDDVIKDLLQLSRLGITAYETSDTYSNGQSLLGRFLSKARQSLPSETFSGIQIHTRYTAPTTGSAPSKATIVDSVDRSLRELNLPRLDLLQLQWWNLNVPGFEETLSLIGDLRKAGKIHHIGTTNFGVQILDRVIAANVPVITNQVQYSILDRRADNQLSAYAERYGINLLTYGALAGGFLGRKWISAHDPAAVPMSGKRFSHEYRSIIDLAGGWNTFQNLLHVLSAVAAKHGCSPSAIALRWVLQKGPGISVLIGASSPKRLMDLLPAFKINLSPTDVATIHKTVQHSNEDVGILERDVNSSLFAAIHSN